MPLTQFSDAHSCITSDKMDFVASACKSDTPWMFSFVCLNVRCTFDACAESIPRGVIRKGSYRASPAVGDSR